MRTSFQHILERGRKNDVILYIESTPGCFEEALELALSDVEPFCWRAAWMIKNCMKKNDPRVEDYLSEIVNLLPEKKDGHQRELIRILLKMSLCEEEEDVIYEFCVKAWKSADNQSSLRHISLRFILELAEKRGDKYEEVLELSASEYLSSLSDGIERSVKKWFDKFLLNSKFQYK